ncbi:MAG: hypothetical protein PWQ07_1298, partial [Kosmotoga sp.]
TEEAEFFENEGTQAHGAGPKMVETLASKGAEVLIAKNVGQNAFSALKQVISQHLKLPALPMDEEVVQCRGLKKTIVSGAAFVYRLARLRTQLK